MADIQATVGTISGEGRNCLYRCIMISLSSAREGKFSIQELRNKLAVFVEAHPDHLSVPGEMESETFEERIRLEFKMTVQQYCIRMRRRNRPAMGGGGIELSAVVQLYPSLAFVTFMSTALKGTFHAIEAYGSQAVATFTANLLWTPALTSEGTAHYSWLHSALFDPLVAPVAAPAAVLTAALATSEEDEEEEE